MDKELHTLVIGFRNGTEIKITCESFTIGNCIDELKCVGIKDNRIIWCSLDDVIYLYEALSI